MIHRRRAAFTRVELLVVIVVLGMLLSLLLPALDRSHVGGRRDDCMVRTRWVALAARNFEALQGYFPGYIMPSGTTSQNYLTSWAVILAPYLERNDIWTSWTTKGGPNSPAATQAYWDQMVCPSNPPSSFTGPVSSYVVNTGRPDNGGSTPPDYAANGMCFNLYNPGSGPKAFVKNSLNDLKSGKRDATTLFSSENILPPTYSPNLSWVPTSNPELQVGFVWQKTTTPTLAAQINGDREDYAKSIPADFPTSNGIMDYCRPMSNHPRGVNVSFADGHIQFLQQSIDYVTYQTLMAADPAYTSSTDASNYASAYIGTYLLKESDF